MNCKETLAVSSVVPLSAMKLPMHCKPYSLPGVCLHAVACLSASGWPPLDDVPARGVQDEEQGQEGAELTSFCRLDDRGA